MENSHNRLPLLSVRDLSKSFEQREILKEVSFDVYEGEILGILGLSGSGKSTLLKILCGFIVEDRGKVTVPNSKKRFHFSSDSEEIRGMMGFSSQQPSFYRELTVSDNLVYFGTISDMDGVDLYNKIDEVLKILDLSEVKKVHAKDLSEGMKKRLDIACSIIHDPKILILDEPTANLDYKLREELLVYIKKINEHNKMTILFVSHYLEEIELISKRVILLVKHRVSVVNNSSNLKEEFTKLIGGKHLEGNKE